MDYSLQSSAILGKNVTNNKKTFFRYHLKDLFMLIKMAQTPASYLIHNPRYNVDNQTTAVHEMKANV